MEMHVLYIIQFKAVSCVCDRNGLAFEPSPGTRIRPMCPGSFYVPYLMFLTYIELLAASEHPSRQRLLMLSLDVGLYTDI